MLLGAVVLAAGAASRMRGGDKLLEPVEGAPLLATLTRRVLDAGFAPCAVTLPPDRPQRAAALADTGATALIVPDAAEGMSASLRRAALWASDLALDALMVVPGDMPELSCADFAHLRAAFEGNPRTPLRATAQDGTPGHPVIFPARLFPAFAALKGDEGARSLLGTNPPLSCALPYAHALTDLNTPEDWADWRARQG